MSRRPRCSACKIDLDMGADRCPQCLRKSTVVDPNAKPYVVPSLRLGGDEPVDESPAHAGVRALSAVIAYAVFGPLLWLILSNERWFESHALWGPACFAAMVLGVMPLRMAFAPPDAPMDAREAARHYAFRMAFVLAMAAGLFTTQALAAWLVADPIIAIFLGLLFALAPMLVVPAILTARREKRSIGAVLMAGAKGIAIAVGVVLMVAILVALRASSSPPPKTIYIPSFPIDLDPSGSPASSARPPR